MNSKEKLITALQDAIKNYQQKIKEIESTNNSSLTKYQQEIEKLKDSNNLVLIDSSIIKKIISDLDYINEENKNSLYEFINTLKILLTLNSNNNTSFEITKEQLNHYQNFLNLITKTKEKQKETRTKNLKDIGKITNLSNQYRSLLGLLEDKENLTFITDLDLLATLFKEQNINETEKREILLWIMKYNQKIYNSSLTTNFKKVHLKRLNIEDVKEVFQKHNYDFLTLPELQREHILNYGTLSNIEDLLTLLEKYHFKKFDLKRDSLKLTTILINCDKLTFSSIVEFSKEKGLTANDLLQILPVLIGQTKNKKHFSKKDEHPEKTKESVPFISGKSTDYIKNIEFLESLGFNISYVYKKCKELLLTNNSRLQNNYKEFKNYGFNFKTDEVGTLTHPALTCLMSNNFAEVVDQFIEVSPKGLEYIKSNPSRILIYSNAKAVVFYNIYASYQTENNYQAEGPFVNKNSTNLLLRGEITRYKGSGYEDIPYRGIEEETKELRTNTIQPNLKNKEEFDLAVETTKALGENLKDLVNNSIELENLERYTDENNPLKYNFEGIAISKLKVKRIFNILKHYNLEDLEDSLLYAITYNTIITETAYNKLKDIVNARRK